MAAFSGGGESERERERQTQNTQNTKNILEVVAGFHEKPLIFGVFVLSTVAVKRPGAIFEDFPLTARIIRRRTAALAFMYLLSHTKFYTWPWDNTPHTERAPKWPDGPCLQTRLDPSELEPVCAEYSNVRWRQKRRGGGPSSFVYQACSGPTIRKEHETSPIL